MAQTTNPLVLETSKGVSQEILAPLPSIDTSLGFQTAHVQNDDPNTKSFYVVDSASNYGTEGAGTGTSRLVPADPLSGSSESVETGFVAQSAQGFDVNNPGIVLFQHDNFLGYGVEFRFSQPDITHSFPVGQIDGASSLICTGGKWELYTKKNYQGAMITMQPGINNSLGEVGLNDKIQSVKFTKQ